MVQFEHQSVMPKEVLDLLVTDATGVYVDATLGAGGHALKLLQTYPDLRLIGVDQDAYALSYATDRLAAYTDRCNVLKGNFRYLTALLASIGVRQVSGILFDLGVSSPQLDQRERGFSYQQEDAPLDMRMDLDNPLTAFRLINQRPEQEIRHALQTFGEERWAARIAQFIVQARQVEPIRTSGQLVDIIRAAVPAAARRSGGHPARRTFQALRIWVNDELGALNEGLEEGWHVLVPSGRLVVIAFHSLEDRIVKNRFRDWSTQSEGRLVTRHPLMANAQELADNPRSRSAKLRAVEKLTH
ncbi:MAG: 16S rRNA (cytosine(1402)-N(4))-methyltransferase [Sulfobacillus acidophilus]|uniref:Ribosomal RNA small subunit methyltransferase H n=1 Tax=Sulfobacillus acidophilus TaxID=53633 RepID=A0A2T2WEN3_9FIRM|nr:MAG: 16S rRNA (cytosine(1402)-N(4))-methyltransferase [Sulfobacillus acidophilus]